jgi:hypothetical protein
VTRAETIDVSLPAEAPTSAGAEPTRVFSTSILVSAIRCTLAYVAFPWLLPAAGIAGGIGPGIGLAVGLVAIGFNIASIRRFWKADHAWKWQITVLNSVVIVMLTVLAVLDVSDLLG